MRYVDLSVFYNTTVTNVGILAHILNMAEIHISFHKTYVSTSSMFCHTDRCADNETLYCQCT
jgi:hypothetical protein